MTDILRIKRRTSGGSGAPAALGNAEMAFNEVDGNLYYGKGGTPAAAASIVNIAGASFAPLASPIFTGAPSLPTGAIGVTQTAGTNSTALATCAFVTTATGAYLPLTGGTLTGDLLSPANYVKAFCVQVTGPNPTFSLIPNASGTQPVNGGVWDLFDDSSGNLNFRALSDNYASSATVMQFIRNGASWTSSTIQVNQPTYFEATAYTETYAANVNPPLFVCRKARGTIAAPTATQTNDFVGQLYFQGYGTAFSAAGSIRGRVIESQTNINAGTGMAGYIDFIICPSNSLTQQVVMSWTATTVQCLAGMNWGSATVATQTDLSRHLALFGTTYGFSITSGALNIVAAGNIGASFGATNMTLYQALSVNSTATFGSQVTVNGVTSLNGATTVTATPAGFSVWDTSTAERAWWNDTTVVGVGGGSGVPLSSGSFGNGVVGSFGVLDQIAAPTAIFQAGVGANSVIIKTAGYGYGNGGFFAQYCARGTYAAPLVNSVNDTLLYHTGWGFDGTSWREGIRIQGTVVASPPSASNFRTRYTLSGVASSSGAISSFLTLDDATLTLTSGQNYVSTATSTAPSTIAIACETGGAAFKTSRYSNDITDVYLQCIKARGTVAAPLAVNQSDATGSVYFSAYSAPGTITNVVRIQGQVLEGTPSTSAMGTAIWFNNVNAGAVTMTRNMWTGDSLVLAGVLPAMTAGSAQFNGAYMGWNVVDSVGTPANIISMHGDVSAGGPGLAMRIYGAPVPTITGMTARGTSAVPTVVQTGDRTLQLYGYSYTGSAWYLATAITMNISEGTPTTSAQGSQMNFWVTATGTTTLASQLALSAQGFTVGPAATFNNGIAFGSQIAASTIDLSSHIALYSTTFGFNITSGTLNVVAAGTQVLAITASGANAQITPPALDSSNLVPNTSWVQAEFDRRFGRNRIINGGMIVDQWNSRAAVVNPATGAFLADRWKYGAATTSAHFTTTVGPFSGWAWAPQSDGALSIQSTAAYAPIATDFFYLHQVVMYANVTDLMWPSATQANRAPITLSFNFQSSVGGTFSGAISSMNGTIVSYPFQWTVTANSFNYIVINIPAPTIGTWYNSGATACLDVRFDLGAGANFRAAANTWATGSFTGVTGATSLCNTTATIYIGNVQLERGTTNTPFEHESYHDVLAKCEVYYQILSGHIFAGYVGGAGATATCTGVSLRNTMRGTPTAVVTGQSYTNGSALSVIVSSVNSVYATIVGTAIGATYCACNVALNAEL